jgi:sialate O-acetylesterase
MKFSKAVLKHTRSLSAFGCLIVVLVSMVAHAEVSLPALLSDGMVMQRDLPLHFWGMSSPGERVTVSMKGEQKSATADELGHWNVYLAPRGAGGPYEVSVRGQNTIVLHDVLVGDVWVASGQSNMEFPLAKAAGAAEDISHSDDPQMRFLEVKRADAEWPQEDVVTTGWKASTRAAAPEFSAVAFYFAREIRAREKVPIGVIEAYWGGTPAESWTSLRALSADPALMPYFAAYSRFIEDEADADRIYKWQAAEKEAAKAKGLPVPDYPWHPQPHMWKPAALFNAMIAPLTSYPIRGVIWYQGETNSKIDRAAYLYERLFKTLITDWRDRWGVGLFPFLYAQISSFTSTPKEDWPAIREAQRRTLELKNTGMAVTIDIGNPDDVHPTNKRDVGARLALIARATVYGESVEYSGPLFRQLTQEDGALRVWFEHAKSGMEAHGPGLTGFEVAGDDGKFYPAEARIDGETIVVSSAEVRHPVVVRYGWANSPNCNLFNREGLPASPFGARVK